MKILSAQQIKELDLATIKAQPIDHVDLMERAAKTFVEWFTKTIQSDSPILILAGKGNNGGDGAAVARLLRNKGFQIEVVVVEYTDANAELLTHNLNRLNEETDVFVSHLEEINHLPDLNKYLIIDAILGIGINRNTSGLLAEVISKVNSSNPELVISIDMPSGLSCEQELSGEKIYADITFAFETPKLSFMLPESYPYVGEWLVRSIESDEEKLNELEAKYIYVESEFATGIYESYPRGKFDHKGNYGHSLIVAGSMGKIGAAILTAKACLKSGAGLVTVHLPSLGYIPLQTSVPDVMVSSDANQTHVTKVPLTGMYDVVGIGPGLGKEIETRRALLDLIKDSDVPIVLDADALNILAEEKDWIEYLPKHSVLTPHLKEFRKLFGKSDSGIKRIEKLRRLAAERQIYVVLKGAHTATATPEGVVFFNDTGNPGMATGGTGDVLAGIITGLISQSWKISDAVIFGVYLHGLAGDLAAIDLSEESLTSSDLINYIPDAFISMVSV